MVLLRALRGDKCLERLAEGGLVSLRAGTDRVEQPVDAGHCSCLLGTMLIATGELAVVFDGLG